MKNRFFILSWSSNHKGSYAIGTKMLEMMVKRSVRERNKGTEERKEGMREGRKLPSYGGLTLMARCATEH